MQQKRSPGTTRRLSCEIPLTSTAEGSPTDSITSMSSKRRFIDTRGMVEPTALHAPDTPATRLQWACRAMSRDVLGLVRCGGRRAAGRCGRRLGTRSGWDVVAVEGVAHDL